MKSQWRIAIGLNVLLDVNRETIHGVVDYSARHPGLHFISIPLLHDEAVPRLLRESDCDGAIVTLTRAAYQLMGESLPSIPIVNMAIDKLSDSIPSVRCVRGEGSRVLLAHLRQQGFDSFAYLGVDNEDLERRGGNLRKELCESELPLEEFSLPGYAFDELQAEWFDDLVQWLHSLVHSGKRTAVLTYDGFRGALIVDACRRLGIDIPETVGIATYTETRTGLTCNPAISSIDTPFYEMGIVAASLLHRMLQGEDPPLEPVEIPGIRVVVRPSSASPDVFRDQIAHAKEFMQKNASRNISIDDCLAQLANITRHNFFRSFKALTGDTPSDYLRHIRVSRAKKLLISTSFSTSHIAEMCGFSSLSHFGRSFKRVVGYTPRDFRKNVCGYPHESVHRDKP